jgi:hypothetical protein
MVLSLKIYASQAAGELINLNELVRVAGLDKLAFSPSKLSRLAAKNLFVMEWAGLFVTRSRCVAW